MSAAKHDVEDRVVVGVVERERNEHFADIVRAIIRNNYINV